MFGKYQAVMAKGDADEDVPGTHVATASSSKDAAPPVPPETATEDTKDDARDEADGPFGVSGEVTEATEATWEKKTRPRRNIKRFMAPCSNDGTSPPEEHFILHRPPDLRCMACCVAKMHKGAARRAPDADRMKRRAKKPLDRVHLDLVGPTKPGLDKCRWTMATKDEATNFPRIDFLRDKLPKTCLRIFVRQNPGSRNEPDPRFPQVVKCDNDGSFQAEFKGGIEDRGASFDNSIPKRPETNSVAEEWHDPFEKSTSAPIEVAGTPYIFWSMAAKHVVFCMA